MRRSHSPHDASEHSEAARLAKENKALERQLKASFAALDGYLEVQTSLEHKLQQRDSELERLRRVVQTAVEHGLHDQNGHFSAASDPQAEEAYLEVKDLAVLLSHDLEQVRIEKHDQELAYQQKINSLEQELHSLRYDLQEAYTHIDASRNTLEADQHEASRGRIPTIDAEVPADVELSSVESPDPAVHPHVPHDIEEQEYDAREDMRRLRAQLEALCRSSPTNTRALEIQSDDGAITTAAHSPERDATPNHGPRNDIAGEQKQDFSQMSIEDVAARAEASLLAQQNQLQTTIATISELRSSLASARERDAIPRTASLPPSPSEPECTTQ